MKSFIPGLLLIISSGMTFPVFAQNTTDIDLTDALTFAAKQRSEDICKKFEALPVEACREIIMVTATSLGGGKIDFDEIKDVFKGELLKPETLNSALAKVFAGEVPFGIELKGFESDNDDNEGASLGISYNANYSFLDESYGDRKKWNKRVAIDFNAAGNVAFNQSANPNDFLDTKLTIDGSWSTAIPVQSEEFQAQLTNLAVTWAKCDEDDPETDECRQAGNAGYEMLDKAAAYLNCFRYYEFGLDAGVESDQKFDALQTKVGVFAFAQYEDWGNQTIIGALGLTPAARVAIDRVYPNNETPRTLAGDSSSFYRFSGEISLWIPIELRKDFPMVLTANYRYYKEINALDVVSQAGLDDYGLFTLSMTGTNGVFVSYSTGELPLDADSDNVVEIGWKFNSQ